jgi:hypothetical protein
MVKYSKHRRTKDYINYHSTKITPPTLKKQSLLRYLFHQKKSFHKISMLDFKNNDKWESAMHIVH